MRATWTALYIETPRSLQLDEETRDRIAETLRLAERLDGEAVTVPAAARRVADDVVAYAHKSNVNHIVVGKSERSRWFEILHGSVVHDLVRRAGNISIHVIPGEDSPRARAAAARRHGCGGALDPLPYIGPCSRSLPRSASG